MKDYFNIKYHRTTYSREILAGVSMFFSVVYILVVNPQILGECGMDSYSVFMATVITSAIATLAMALYAKMPIVLAPGLSINTMFVWTTVREMGGDYRMTLLATYFSGVLFILLVISGVFQKIDRQIPLCVKYGILTGVGISLIRTGLEAVNVMQHPFSMEILIVIIGVGVMMWLMHRKVKGAIFFGMVITAIVGYTMTAALGGGDFLSELKQLFQENRIFSGDSEVFLANCFRVPSLQLFFEKPLLLWKLAVASITFTLFHFVDAIGTTSSLFAYMEANEVMLPEEYKKKSMYVNGVAEMASGLLGTSSATSYAETVVGITEGARTGVASLTVAILFLISGLIVPRFGIVASFVTAPAVIVAGGLSCRILKQTTDWSAAEKLVTYGLAVYIGLTFQVAFGFVFGMIGYVLCCRIRKRH